MLFVVGYPQSISKYNTETVPYEQSLQHLIEEVDAGADFIITQMIFEAREFLEFVDECRKCGITAPVIPGIFPIQVKVCFFLWCFRKHLFPKHFQIHSFSHFQCCVIFFKS